MDRIKHCMLCPRNCGVNRLAGQTGYCKMTDKVMASRAALHMWEDPCISGKEGSGTIFFSGCGLGCAYCQNREIALGDIAKEITKERLAEIFLELQKQGANNINLVTPTHFVPQIKEAIVDAKRKGLVLPILYNTGGYEKVETLKSLEGLIHIYLPDMKYVSPELSKRYSNASNYFRYAKEAIKEMVRQCPKPIFNQKGIMVQGVMVRHLVLPGAIEDSKRVIRYLYKNFGDRIYISIMSQYTPTKNFLERKELNRPITEEEYQEVVEYACSLGVEQAYIQEGETAKESFIPAFDFKGL